MKTYTTINESLTKIMDKAIAGEVSPQAAASIASLAHQIIKNEVANLQYCKQRGDRPQPGYFPAQA